MFPCIAMASLGGSADVGKRTLYLLGALGIAGALLLFVKFKKGGQEFVLDGLDEVIVTARRVGASIADAMAALGDWTKKVPANLRALFEIEGARNGMPPGLLEAVAYRESRFRPDIIDGRTRSAAGAVGIMQVVPKWHPGLGESGALDPSRAVPYAANYLRTLYNKFGSWRLALAAYNWGQGNLQAKDLADGIVGDDWPAETRLYVEEITRNAGLA
jgi:soluble lytic murein transglycosylase-like protein